jgi:hypothetical protein
MARKKHKKYTRAYTHPKSPLFRTKQRFDPGKVASGYLRAARKANKKLLAMIGL